MSIVLIIIGILLIALAVFLTSVSEDMSAWEDKLFQFLIDAGSEGLAYAGIGIGIVAACFIIIGFLNLLGIIQL